MFKLLFMSLLQSTCSDGMSSMDIVLLLLRVLLKYDFEVCFERTVYSGN